MKESKISVELAHRLLKLRKEKKMSREKLAELAECSTNSIYYYENAERSITKDKAKRFAEIFCIDREYLLDESVAYKTALERFSIMHAASLKDNHLMYTAIISLATLNGYDVECERELNGTLDEMITQVKNYMSFYKDGKKSFTLSIDEANTLGNNLSDALVSNINMIKTVKMSLGKEDE